jgi:hypothetical protein
MAECPRPLLAITLAPPSRLRGHYRHYTCKAIVAITLAGQEVAALLKRPTDAPSLEGPGPVRSQSWGSARAGFEPAPIHSPALRRRTPRLVWRDRPGHPEHERTRLIQGALWALSRKPDRCGGARSLRRLCGGDAHRVFAVMHPSFPC